MKIALDTNVLIAALISRGSCHDLVEYILRNHKSIGSDYIRNETIEKLISKFDFSISESKESVNFLYEKIEVVHPVDFPSSGRIKDKDDVQVVGTAISGNCEILITGDKELMALKNIEGIRIVSPSDAWRLV